MHVKSSRKRLYSGLQYLHVHFCQLSIFLHFCEKAFVLAIVWNPAVRRHLCKCAYHHIIYIGFILWNYITEKPSSEEDNTSIKRFFHLEAASDRSDLDRHALRAKSASQGCAIFDFSSATKNNILFWKLQNWKTFLVMDIKRPAPTRPSKQCEFCIYSLDNSFH